MKPYEMLPPFSVPGAEPKGAGGLKSYEMLPSLGVLGGEMLHTGGLKSYEMRLSLNVPGGEVKRAVAEKAHEIHPSLNLEGARRAGAVWTCDGLSASLGGCGCGCKQGKVSGSSRGVQLLGPGKALDSLPYTGLSLPALNEMISYMGPGIGPGSGPQPMMPGEPPQGGLGCLGYDQACRAIQAIYRPLREQVRVAQAWVEFMAQAIVPCVGMDWRQLGPCDALKRIYEELERQVIVIETQREAARMMNPGADLTDFSRRIEALGAEAAQRAWERCEEQRRVGDRGFTIERSEECIARHQSLIWAHFVLIIALNNLNRQAPDLSEAVRRLSERWPDCTTPCVLEYP